MRAPVRARVDETARPSRCRPPPLPTLYCPAGPARSAACDSVSVVSTPNAIGMPVSPAASMIPCATADEMYSKCGVAPRMTQPRQTIGIEPAGLCSASAPPAAVRTRPERELLDIAGRRPGFSERGARARGERVGDRLVEPGDDDRKSIAGGRGQGARRSCGILVAHRLLPPELRFAFLEERFRPFAHVLGRGDQSEQRRFEILRLGERHLAAPDSRRRECIAPRPAPLTRASVPACAPHPSDSRPVTTRLTRPSR